VTGAHPVDPGPGDWVEHADRLAAEAIAAGDPTGWFERLYAAGRTGSVRMPWDRSAPQPLLVHWAQQQGQGQRLLGAGLRALVVGCGLGADAEYVAGLGFDTVAFDVSDTAIRTARARFPDSPVRYRTADLLDPPPDWRRAFDLVVEVYTVQALPDPPRRDAIANVAGMVAAGGTLVVIAAAHTETAIDIDIDTDIDTDTGSGHEDPGPPWPLRRAELDAFATGDLAPVRIEAIPDRDDPARHRWLAEYRAA
jgi:SAM-dependent methyltransferase